jgi:hypothetical protein
VAVRVVPTKGGSSFAARSASETGWYDFGVNATRLDEWQRAMEARLAR